MSAAALVAVLLATAAPALAKGAGHGGRPEVRVAGTCSAGASSTLRLRSDDGQIRVDFELERHGVGGENWRFVLVHERRVVWRTSGRTSAPSGVLEISHTVRDYAGPDQVSVIASGPGGVSCDASATLLGQTS
jgi:hypothetical protein